MDFNRLRTGDLITGICGVLLIIVMFFAWYGVGGAIGEFAEAAGVETNANAWEAFDFIDIVLFVTALVAISAAVLAASGRSVALPVAASVIVTILGIVVALLVLYRLINEPGPDEAIDIKFGAYLGFLVCVGIAVGGFLSMADEGTSLGQAARDVQGSGGGRPATGGAPPPSEPPRPAPPPSEPPAGGAPPPGSPPPSGGGPPPASG